MDGGTQTLLTDRSNHRQSNIELLRIVAMLMIVFHHFAIHGGFVFESTTLSIPRFWYNFIIMGGKIGVNLFVLISGYFLAQSTTTRINLCKLLKLWGQVFFYSVIIYIGSVICTNSVSIRPFFRYSMPITRTVWWFASTYFVLYLIHPYINLLLHSMDKLTYQCFLSLILFSWCVIPTILNVAFESNNLLWFITLYSLAGYLKTYGLNTSLSSHSGVLAVVLTILMYASSAAFTILGARWQFFSPYITYFYGMKHFLTLSVSVCLFMAFANMKIKFNKWINLISSATFGVYLIHDSEIIRPLLWNTVFHNASYQNSVMLIPYSVAVVIIVYVFCTLIDLLRQILIERVYMRFINQNVGQLSLIVPKMGSFLQRTFFGD